ncbi:MAG: hypothetical protein FWG63_09040 [Defluviitaleaceae bacterium]|nr:hypothetical protein [Defluviitaleaceae bacterium]
MKDEKKSPFTEPLTVAFVILIGILIVVLFLLLAVRQADNPLFASERDSSQNNAGQEAFTAELDARQNAVINLAETWLTEELGLDLRTQPVYFDTRLDINNTSEIWRVEITNPMIRRINATPQTNTIATLNINRITGDITALNTNFRKQEIYVNGANITVINLTAIRTVFPEREVYVPVFNSVTNAINITINELQAQRSENIRNHIEGGGTLPATEPFPDITEVAAIVATEITQKFNTNLDGANFIMAFTGDFWSINVLLNPEQMRIGELPHIAPDFHALFDVEFNINRILSLTDF